MNNLIKLALGLSLLLVIPIGITKSVNSQDSLEFFTDQVGLSGAGCPKGTFQVTALGNKLSIIFNSFQAVAQPGDVTSSYKDSCGLQSSRDRHGSKSV